MTTLIKETLKPLFCRICHEDGNLEELIDPCECSGTLALIHTSCLEKWLSTSNTERCEICKYQFSLQKKKKCFAKNYQQWSTTKNVHGPQGLTGDVICLVILTPLSIIATYLCGMGASVYMRLGFWEGFGLAVLSCMLVATYCLWLVVTFRFHWRSWKEWCQRNQDIKLLVRHRLSDEDMQNRTVNMESQDRNNEPFNSNNYLNNDRQWNRSLFWFINAFNNSKKYLVFDVGQSTTV